MDKMKKDNLSHPQWEDKTIPNSTQWDPSEANTQPFPVQPQFPAPYEEDAIERLQPIRVSNTRAPLQKSIAPKRQKKGCGCCSFVLLFGLLVLLVGYLIFPGKTNILIIGIDRAPEGTDLSRTDTNIVMSVDPLKPTVNMLSIPRDLWVSIPNYGENRINTAHFFAEAEQAGSGPAAAMDTVRQNFGLTINNYIRIRFDGLKSIVDAMGGITITLSEPMSGYDAGQISLNGDQALAFARDRSGSDDFFRMQRGQMVIMAVVKKMLNPAAWLRLPVIIPAAIKSLDTDIPVWQMPRLGVALIRAVITDTMNAKTITREMVTPITTDQGANVLIPNWDAINPLLMELFGE